MKEQSTTKNETINARIRAACGYGPVAEAQPAAAGEEQPRKLPSANAGNGASASGVGTPREDISKKIRDAAAGNGPKSWTTYG